MSNFKPVDAAVEQLLAALDQAEQEGKALQFVQDWVVSADVNGSSGHVYTGFNVMRCALARVLSGYSSNVWLTAKQAKTLGGTVRKEEWANSTILLRPKRFQRTDDETGEQVWVTTGFLYFRAYNLDQVDGIDPDKFAKYQPVAAGAGTVEEFEQQVEACGVKVVHTDPLRAYYSPVEDHVNIPPAPSFTSTEGYYITLGHEVIHWTGHKSRLNRFESNQEEYKTGRKSYAADELVAELGGFALCAHYGVDADEDNAVAYLKSWHRVFKDEGSSALVSAATKAGAAVRYILEGAPKKEG